MKLSELNVIKTILDEVRVTHPKWLEEFLTKIQRLSDRTLNQHEEVDNPLPVRFMFSFGVLDALDGGHPIFDIEFEEGAFDIPSMYDGDDPEMKAKIDAKMASRHNPTARKIEAVLIDFFNELPKIVDITEVYIKPWDMDTDHWSFKTDKKVTKSDVPKNSCSVMVVRAKNETT